MPLPKTGKFPTSPKGPGMDFRAAQMEGQRGFKRGSFPEKGFGGYSDHCTYERTYGPYGSLKGSGGGNEGNTVKKVGRALVVPEKSRKHMTEKLPTTKPPKGNISPVRGEGPPAR